MSRTTAVDVQAILGGNWDGKTDLTPYIDTASAVVDDVVECATARSVTVTATRAELIERWLAAHYYTQMDPLYTSKSTQSASGSFKDHGYDKTAIGLDPSGCLSGVLNGRKVARTFWLGQREYEETDYAERNSL